MHGRFHAQAALNGRCRGCWATTRCFGTKAAGTCFVHHPRPVPAILSRLDVATGQRTPWRELSPPDAVGVRAVGDITGTPDGKAYAYSYYRRLSELFVVEGLR